MTASLLDANRSMLPRDSQKKKVRGRSWRASKFSSRTSAGSGRLSRTLLTGAPLTGPWIFTAMACDPRHRLLSDPPATCQQLV